MGSNEITLWQFLLAIIASLIAGYILAITDVFIKWLPFLEFKKTGIVKIFKDQEKATKSLKRDIEKSQILHVLAMKGETFSHPKEPFEAVLKNTGIEQKYLISSLDNPYLAKRASELDKGNMQDTVNLSANNFQEASKKNSNIKIGRHNEVVRFRIILLSDFLYLSYQEVNIPGRKSPIIKIEKNSAMYRTFSSLFNDLWECYVDKKPPICSRGDAEKQ